MSELAGQMLSDDEETMLYLRAMGMSNIQVAHQMDLSEQTIKNHIRIIFQKLNVTNIVEALTAKGYINLPEKPEPVIQRARCDYIAQCGRPQGHRGQHGGFRPVR